ncbi:MAG: gliding motility-associated C-terminal domain-containing protein, partial [Ekhidna sp.]|nr:gliding motility-associated C-terminal domain-containing protein [Ekhidna sp.]
VFLTVVNRAGVEVFRLDSDDPETTINVHWDGKTNRGMESPPGVYYYSAEVTFNRLNSNDQKQVIKGWVQLIR